MLLLATSLGGLWSVEQPGGSTLQFYPAFRHTIRAIFDVGGPEAALPSRLI